MSITVYSHEFKVPSSCIDTNNHVNNVAYIQWLQDAAIAHSNALGATIEFYTKSGGTWVVRSHFIEYLKPLFLDEDIVIQTWVTAIKRTTSIRKYAIFRKSDKALIARAETLWVYISFKSGKLVSIPKELIEKYIEHEEYQAIL